MSNLAEYEVHVNGQMMAGTSGPKVQSFSDAAHYARQYAEEGIVEVFEVRRANGRVKREIVMVQYVYPGDRRPTARQGGKGE